MKIILLQMIFTTLLFSFSGTMKADPLSPSTTTLHQEISSILKNRNLSFMKTEAEIVKVDFLINARNEIVILHTDGTSSKACDYVKEVLNFKKVKFKQAKQLTPYEVNIKLVK